MARFVVVFKETQYRYCIVEARSEEDVALGDEGHTYGYAVIEDEEPYNASREVWKIRPERKGAR